MSKGIMLTVRLSAAWQTGRLVHHRTTLPARPQLDNAVGCSKCRISAVAHWERGIHAPTSHRGHDQACVSSGSKEMFRREPVAAETSRLVFGLRSTTSLAETLCPTPRMRPCMPDSSTGRVRRWPCRGRSSDSRCCTRAVFRPSARPASGHGEPPRGSTCIGRTRSPREPGGGTPTPSSSGGGRPAARA